MKCPVQRLQKETTSKEFIRWKIILDEEIHEITSIHYYLANIAGHIEAVNSKSKKKIDIEKKLIKFEKKKKEATKEMSLDERIKNSQRMWLGAAGYKFNKDRTGIEKIGPPVRKRVPRKKK